MREVHFVAGVVFSWMLDGVQEDSVFIVSWGTGNVVPVCDVPGVRFGR